MAGGYEGFDGSGDKVFLSGGASHKIYEFTLTGGFITQERVFAISGMPSGLALSPDGAKLYTACYTEKRVAEVDILSGIQSNSFSAHLFPYDVKISPDGGFAYVSNHGVGTVSVRGLWWREIDSLEDLEEVRRSLPRPLEEGALQLSAVAGS